MRYIVTVIFLVIQSINVFSQSEGKNLFRRFYNNHVRISAEHKKAQIFAEVSPQFFAYGGYGAGIGVEFARFQTGFISLNTELKPVFRDAIFENAKSISVPKNAAAEVFANVFLRKDRKGLYAGTIYSYDWYSVTDDKTQQKEDFTKQYLVGRIGFRWFPFKEYFYVDGGFGVSFNLSGSDERTLGDSKYSAKPVVALPFFAVGGRFFLSSKKNK